MPSTIDTILALAPVFLGVGTELSGPTITNLAGGVNGTYDAAATFGHPSPIETDPSIFSVGNVVGSVPATAGSPTDLLANFTWLVFAYYDAAIATTAHALGRTQQFGQTNGILTGFNSGSIASQITIDDGSPLGLYRPLLDPVAPVSGNFYMITTTRNSAVGTLYRNDQVADSRSDLTTDPVYLIAGPGLPWWIGRSGGSAAFPGIRTVMVALFDYPLDAAQVASVYQSSINSLFLNGYSNVVPSAVLYSDVEPDPVAGLLRHNWASTSIERISFLTGISTAAKGYESGNALRIKPRREIEIAQVVRDDSERRALRARLNAHQHHKWWIPILEDRERLAAPIALGVSVIPTDTLYKDYEIGGYVELRQLNDAGRIITSEQLLITGLTDTEITTATLTANSYTNPEVLPVRRGIVDAQLSLRGHTDSVEDTVITARLIAEDEKTIPHRIVEWSPLTTYKSHEVYPNELWPNNWTDLRDYEVTRAREDVDYDTGAFGVESDAIAASESFSWRILIDNRESQAEFLGWFYARAGSLNYLWVPTMQRDFEIVSIAGDELTVADHNYFDNYAGSEFRRDLAFMYNDHSIIIRRIDSVALDGVSEVLNLNVDAPTLTNLRSLSYLLFCRLDGDTLEIARETDTKARFAWRFREILSSPT